MGNRGLPASNDARDVESTPARTGTAADAGATAKRTMWFEGVGGRSSTKAYSPFAAATYFFFLEEELMASSCWVT